MLLRKSARAQVCAPETTGENSAVAVEWLPRQREVSFPYGLRQRRVGVDEGRDVVGGGFPVDDQLRLGDEVTDPLADHVNAENRPVLRGDEVDRTGGLQDLRATVAGEVVGGGDDVVAALLRLLAGQADRGDLGVRVGDPG